MKRDEIVSKLEEIESYIDMIDAVNGQIENDNSVMAVMFVHAHIKGFTADLNKSMEELQIMIYAELSDESVKELK